jgi:hypothetical protein
LLDEPGLGFEGLPHIGIERALGDVAVNLHFGIEISLPENSPLALLDVARAPGRVEMMESAKAALRPRYEHVFKTGALSQFVDSRRIIFLGVDE